MKIIPFNVPKTTREAFRLQVDRLPHFYDKLHQHPETQLMLIEKGEGTLVAGDYVGRFAAGDLFLIGSHQAHVFRSDDQFYQKKGNRVAQSISIYFDEQYAGESFWQLAEVSTIRQFLHRSACGFRINGSARTQGTTLLRLLARQKGIEKLITFFQFLKILSESSELGRLAVDMPANAVRAGEGKRMNDILHFTFKESQRKIYIEEVASIANLTNEAFCRYFKLHTRKTYTAFLNEVRVSNARQLLITTEKPVREICFETGFNNLAHFNRVFKKITGKTPRHYLQLPA